MNSISQGIKFVNVLQKHVKKYRIPSSALLYWDHYSKPSNLNHVLYLPILLTSASLCSDHIETSQLIYSANHFLKFFLFVTLFSDYICVVFWLI